MIHLHEINYFLIDLSPLKNIQHHINDITTETLIIFVIHLHETNYFLVDLLKSPLTTYHLQSAVYVQLIMSTSTIVTLLWVQKDKVS